MSNTISKDLASENAFVVMTTLTLLRYFLSEDLVDTIMPTLKKLMKHPTSIIRRKVLLVMANIGRLYPKKVDNVRGMAI